MSAVEPPIPPEEDLRELAVQAAIHLSSVLRVAAVYDSRDHIVQIQVDKLERTLRDILGITPGATITGLGSELFLNDLRVPSRASQYKFIRTVLDEFARREMAGIRFAPGFEREELNHFLDEFLRSGVTGTALLDACRASGEGHVMPLTYEAMEGFDESDDEVGLDLDTMPEPLAPAEAKADPLAARRRSASVVRGTRALFQSVRMEDLAPRQAKQIVLPIVDAAGSDEPVWVAPSSLGPQDDYAAAHAVNVCSLAASIGRWLGLDRRTLSDLGVAALFHDIGQAQVTEGPDPESEGDVSGHCVAGAQLIARSTAMSLTAIRCVRVALEHHRVPAAERPMSVLSQIVAVADIYVSYAMRTGVPTPRAALGLALAECRGRFEDGLLWALAQAAPTSSGSREAA